MTPLPYDVYAQWRPYVDPFLQAANYAAQVAGYLTWYLRQEQLKPTVTSWYRDPEHNAAVGGDPFSWHQIGAALDIVSDHPDIIVYAAQHAGLDAIDEGDHVHIEPRGPSPLRQTQSA